MTSDPSESTPSRPLEVVGDEAAPAAAPGAEDAEAGGRGGGLRKVFWIAAFAVVLLAVAALGTTGYLGQREMRERITALEGELADTRTALATEQTALAAEQARADGLQTTMGRVNALANQLAASLEELQILTGGNRPEATAEPSPASTTESTTEATAAGESGDEVVEGAAAAGALTEGDSAAGALTESDAVNGNPDTPAEGAATDGAPEEADSPPTASLEPLAGEPALGAPEFLPASAASTAPSETAALAEAEAGAELPAVSAAPPPANGADSASADGDDGRGASEPVPLWRQIVERLRALAPSE